MSYEPDAQVAGLPCHRPRTGFRLAWIWSTSAAMIVFQTIDQSRPGDVSGRGDRELEDPRAR